MIVINWWMVKQSVVMKPKMYYYLTFRYGDVETSDVVEDFCELIFVANVVKTESIFQGKEILGCGSLKRLKIKKKNIFCQSLERTRTVQNVFGECDANILILNFILT
jgi:hypothetical protein